MTTSNRATEQEPSEHSVGKYELVARLAIGGMGELFLARERGIAGFERLVVIKRILPGLAARSSFREMFLREARILARVNHPNVVQTFELGKDDEGNYYLVLEYIRGSTLRELTVLAEENEQPIPVEVIIGIVMRGLRGLHAAHELTDLQGVPLGLVHRDVSPHNLMCTPDGNVKLFDFGVAKATEQGELTYSGMLKGKFAYMSPEQCRRQPLDRRSDVFSVGVVMWELLARQRLFKRESELDTMNAITSGSIPDLRELAQDLPDRLYEIVDRSLAVDPDERFDDAAQFEAALQELGSDAGLDTGVARIAAYIDEVASDRLEQRESTLAAALERALTANERLGLIHATGSWTESAAFDDIEETIQVQPISLRDLAEEEEDEADASGESSAVTPRPRWVPAVAGFVIVALLAAAAHWATVPALSGPPIVIAWAPVIESDVLRNELEPVRQYLEAELERPVTIEITESYLDSADRIIDGRADLAVLPPYTYVITKEREPGVEPLVSKIFDGSKSSDGLILVPFESRAKTIADLKGKKFCFSDENSTTGYVLPRAYIKQQGFDPDQFVGETHFSGDHLTVLKDLLSGRCQAGATYSGNLLTAGAKGVATGKLRRLAITGSVPHGTMTASPALEEETRQSIVDALLAFDPRECCDREYIGETQRITGFSPQFDEGYEQLRRGLGK